MNRKDFFRTLAAEAVVAPVVMEAKPIKVGGAGIENQMPYFFASLERYEQERCRLKKRLDGIIQIEAN